MKVNLWEKYMTNSSNIINMVTIERKIRNIFTIIE